MIVLGKDKIDERFNILPDGTIVDLNGNLQDLILHQGRYEFKGIKVHKIQMWTNYGYRDSKIWDVHHLDENPLNNSLSNLVYLTHSKHASLHHKGQQTFLGKSHTEEVKQKIRESKIGENNPMYGKPGTFLGKHHTKESKQKLSDKAKLYHWFNDGIKNYRCKECPQGCKEGRLKWK